jgi:V/A-type H+-transporting ATPase subunit C
LDIDFYNILSILRGKFWGLDEQHILDLIVTQTGSAPKDLLGRMISAESVKDAMSELSSTAYKELIPQTDNPIDALSEFERSFELAIYKAINRTFSRMFSFATVIGILKLTTYEIRNLSAIAFAVEQQIPVQSVMAKLVIEE